MSAEDVLRAARTVLLIDWPSRDVSDTVARAGYAVTVKGGPDSYARYEIVGDDVLRTPCPKPAAVDVVYVHRPFGELPDILTLATSLGCRAVWMQTPDPRARGRWWRRPAWRTTTGRSSRRFGDLSDTDIRHVWLCLISG